MHRSRIVDWLVMGGIVMGCTLRKKPTSTDNDLATIVINELNADGYERAEMEVVALSPGASSSPRQSFQRGNQTMKEAAPVGRYLIKLDFFHGTDKVYSADYCPDPLRNNEVDIKSGVNSPDIEICNQMKVPLNISVVITPILDTAGTKSSTPNVPPQGSQIPTGSVVAQNGWLRVSGTQLVGENGAPVRLKGVSSHGLQWNGARFVNGSAIKWLADNWKISVFRLAMYTVQGGYVENPAVADKVAAGVEAAVNAGIYVIIDWHILYDGDPNTNKEKAKAFFASMSARYKDIPNVLYEICNEPNGGNVNWLGSIKGYAEEVIPVIRSNASRSVILVGTGTWSQDVLDVASSPLPFSNIMYTLHFYAGTHTQWLRDRTSSALDRGVPIFVTEWGTSAADGSNGNYFDEADHWMTFLASKNISWINWSFADFGESSAILKSGAGADGGWSDSDFTVSGLYVRKQILAP